MGQALTDGAATALDTAASPCREASGYCSSKLALPGLNFEELLSTELSFISGAVRPPPQLRHLLVISRCDSSKLQPAQLQQCTLCVPVHARFTSPLPLLRPPCLLCAHPRHKQGNSTPFSLCGFLSPLLPKQRFFFCSFIQTPFNHSTK